MIFCVRHSGTKHLKLSDCLTKASLHWLKVQADTVTQCDTRLIGSFREEPGIFPGWHMNKAHWLTVALDETVDDEKVKFLADMSYELTK